MGTESNRELDFGKWMALAAALLGWMFDGFEMGIIPPVARPALIELLGLSEKADLATSASDPVIREQAKAGLESEVGLWIGRIMAAFLMGAALGGWAFGWLGDRVGRVRAMIFSVLTYSLFTSLCGLAQQVWQLAGLRFLAALGMGGEWALGVALVMESWPGHLRPLLAGLIGAASNIGFMIAPFLVMAMEGLGVRVNAGGWRWVLGACALPALLTFFIRMFVPESEKWQQAVRTGPKARLADIFTPALRRRTIIGAMLGAVALVGTWGSVQWIPPWVNRMTGGDQQLTNFSQITSSLGAIVGSFCGAVVVQYFSRRWAYFALCAGSLLLCAFLFRHFDEGAPIGWGFFLTVFGVGLFTAAFYGWLPLYLPELFPTRVRATGQGFAYNCGRVLAAGGALSMGFLMSDKVFQKSYAEAGATLSLVYAFGLVLIWLAPKARGPLPE